MRSLLHVLASRGLRQTANPRGSPINIGIIRLRAPQKLFKRSLMRPPAVGRGPCHTEPRATPRTRPGRELSFFGPISGVGDGCFASVKTDLSVSLCFLGRYLLRNRYLCTSMCGSEDGEQGSRVHPPTFRGNPCANCLRDLVPDARANC